MLEATSTSEGAIPPKGHFPTMAPVSNLYWFVSFLGGFGIATVFEGDVTVARDLKEKEVMVVEEGL